MLWEKTVARRTEGRVQLRVLPAVAEVFVAELGDDEAELVGEPCRDESAVAPRRGGGRVFPTDQDRLVAAGEALEIEHHLVRIKFAKDLDEVPLSV